MFITVALETVKNAFTFRGMSHSCFRCIRHRSHWNSLTEFQHTRFTSPLPLSSRLRATFFVKPRLIPIMLSFNFYVNRLFLMLSITSKLGSESQSSLQRHAYRWRLVSCLFIQPQSLCFQINLITACSLVKWAVFVYFSNFCEANTFFIATRFKLNQLNQLILCWWTLASFVRDREFTKTERKLRQRSQQLCVPFKRWICRQTVYWTIFWQTAARETLIISPLATRPTEQDFLYDNMQVTLTR